MVGYNSQGNFYHNHPASGFATVADIVSCGISQQGGRRKRQTDRFRRVTMMELPTDPTLRESAEDCISHYVRDIAFGIIPTDLAELVSDFPCPPTLRQLEADTGRYVLHTQSPLCYVSANPQTSTPLSMVIRTAAAQQCCYDNGYVPPPPPPPPPPTKCKI